jgi:hypothetical protein
MNRLNQCTHVFWIRVLVIGFISGRKPLFLPSRSTDLALRSDGSSIDPSIRTSPRDLAELRPAIGSLCCCGGSSISRRFDREMEEQGGILLPAAAVLDDSSIERQHASTISRLLSQPTPSSSQVLYRSYPPPLSFVCVCVCPCFSASVAHISPFLND